tara:strand:+ start:812 stop:1363 length:552 start_codon:yes stop_codon:yes gene_type:complete
MATAKTGSFYLTETVIIPASSATGTRIQGEIDLGAYVNVATGQALAVESVDIVVQAGAGFNQLGTNLFTGDGCISTQVTDLNPGSAFVRADNQSLIASSALNLDHTNNVLTHQADLYPDNFGPTALSEAFMVVNDSLYVVAGTDGAAVGAGDLAVTARIKCRIAKLSAKDFMAIAIQSTASDN